QDAFTGEPEKDNEHGTVLDMIPGDPGVGPVAGTYGTGDCPGAEGEEGEDSNPASQCTVYEECRDGKESAGEYKNEQDAGKGVGHALVRRIRDRVPGVCIDPAHERGTYPPGKLDDEPRERAEGKMFWPGHMNVGQEDTGTGTGNNQHHEKRVGQKKGTT